MSLKNRIKLIMKENNLKQKELASTVGVSESYISAIVNERNTDLSLSLAMLIEEKFGYYAQWVISGTEPKMKQVSKNKSLSDIHQKAILQLEKMNEQQAKAVLAFVNSLDQIEKIIKEPLNEKQA